MKILRIFATGLLLFAAAAWMQLAAATVNIDTSGTYVITDGDDLALNAGPNGEPLLVTLESANGAFSDISVGSISANVFDFGAAVGQAGGILFFSGDLTITSPGNPIAFSQEMGFSLADSAFGISGGLFAFENVFSLADADVTLMDAEIVFSNGAWMSFEVNSLLNFGNVTGAGAFSDLDFQPGSFLNIDVADTLGLGDSFQLLSNLDSITGAPSNIQIVNTSSSNFVTLTQDSGNSDLYSGMLDGKIYEFEFDRANGSADLAVVPEPSTAAFLGLIGGLALLSRRWR